MAALLPWGGQQGSSAKQQAAFWRVGARREWPGWIITVRSMAALPLQENRECVSHLRYFVPCYGWVEWSGRESGGSEDGIGSDWTGMGYVCLGAFLSPVLSFLFPFPLSP